MSAQNGVMVACETIQAKLPQYWATCTPAEKLPLYEFMLSQGNTTNTLQEVVSPGDAKIKTVRLTYTPRILHTDVTTGATHPTCTASTVRGNRWTDYTISPTSNFRIEELLTLADYERVCDPNSMIFAQKIGDMLDAIDRAAAYSLTAQAVVKAGSWGSDVVGDDASNNLEVATLRAGSADAPAFNTAQKIKRATEQSGYCAPYAIFSGATYADYADAIKLGCCADYGIDLRATFAEFGSAVLYDRAITSAFGDEDFGLVVMNQALQVVTWNLYTGDAWKAFSAGNETNMIMRTRRGLPVDVNMVYSCGAWHIIMTATAETKAMPYDMFAAGDIFNGVNFVNKIEVVNT